MKLDPLKLTASKLSQLDWNKCILLEGGDGKLWIIEIDGAVSLNELKLAQNRCSWLEISVISSK